MLLLLQCLYTIYSDTKVSLLSTATWLYRKQQQQQQKKIAKVVIIKANCEQIKKKKKKCS